MRHTAVRLAARAVIVEEDRLLIVNAWPGGKSQLMCAPGGGVDPGQSLPENLSREVYEETGLEIEVGHPCMINEFHDPASGFHQVEVFFRCQIIAGSRSGSWTDPEAVVTERRWVTAEELTDDRLDFGASAQDEFILGTILEARVKARVGVRARVILGTIPRALSRMLCHCSVMCCKDSVPLCLCGVVVGPRGPWGGMGGHVGHGGPQGAMVLVLWYSAVVPSRSPDWTVVLMYGHLHS